MLRLGCYGRAEVVRKTGVKNAVMYSNNDYYKALIFVFKTIFSWIEGNRQQKINLKACKTYADTGR